MLHIPLGTNLERVALRWTGFEQNFSGTDAAPVGGFSRVIAALAAELKHKGGQIYLAEQVQQIALEDQRLKIISQDSKGALHESLSRVGIVTFPLSTLKKSAGTLFRPHLSDRKQAVIQRVNVGDLNKVLLVYEDPWWDVTKGSFTVLPSVQGDTNTEDVRSILASTTLLVTAEGNKLLSMVGAESGAALEKFKREHVTDALHRYLSERLQHTDSMHPVRPPLHNFMSRWSSHDLTGGATTTPVVVGQDTSPLDFGEWFSVWSVSQSVPAQLTFFASFPSLKLNCQDQNLPVVWASLESIPRCTIEGQLQAL